MAKQRIIAISNQKGGTAKTTSTANLGAALSMKSKKVLLVDMDAQGNLGQAVGLKPQGELKTISDVLLRKCSIEDIAAEIHPSLYIAFGNQTLIDTELELVSAKARENRLKTALMDAPGFDYILIDCPPNLGLLTLNALTAATEVLIPVEAEYFAASGCALLENTINDVKTEINPELKISGVLITKANITQNLYKEVSASIREHFGDLVFDTVIPKNVSVAEAQPLGQSVLEFSPNSKGSEAYLALAKEIINQETSGF